VDLRTSEQVSCRNKRWKNGKMGFWFRLLSWSSLQKHKV